MATSKLIGRSANLYAGALFDVAKGQSAVAEIEEELAGVCQLFREDATFRAYAESPIVENREKDRVVQSVFKGQVHPLLFNLLRVLAGRGRLVLLNSLDGAFREQVDRESGRLRARLEFARPADAELVQKIDAQLTRASGHEVVCEAAVDESLIGGLRIRVGDHVLDGSAKNRLMRLSRHMQEAWFHGVQD